VKEAVADAEVEIPQEEAAQAPFWPFPIWTKPRWPS
jgi:hypothetical protein